MSNLGFHNLFFRLSFFPGIRTARFFYHKREGLFCPEIFNPKKRELFPDGKPSLRHFDICFISVSYELDYLNILKMFASSCINPLSNQRQEKDPIIVVGGIAVTANPLVISPFADMVYMGDMEVGLEKILTIMIQSGFKKSKSLFTKLEQIEGVYIPEPGKEAPPRGIWTELSFPAHSAVITGKTIFSNMFLVELVRGCSNHCAFCMTRCVASPVRVFSRDKIMKVVKIASKKAVRVGLIAPVLQDHPDLVAIVKDINRMGLKVSFSSLRADMFSREIAELFISNEQKSLTFAPETGSDELRRKIGKALKNEQLFEAVALAVEKGVKQLRYYLMYGLPGEKKEDIGSTIELVKKTVSLLGSPDSSLYLSINPFVPKKSTPLANRGIFKGSYYSQIKHIITEGLKNYEKVHLKFESLRLFYIHFLLSTGDWKTGELLYTSFKSNSYRPLEEAAKARAVESNEYL